MLSLVLLCCLRGYLAPYKYDRDMNDREAHFIQVASSPDHPRTNEREKLAALQEWDADEIYINTTLAKLLGYLAHIREQKAC